MFHQYCSLPFFMFFVIVPTVGGCNERRVVNAIFKNYSKLVRPVLQQNQTLDVRYELRVYNIISVNEPEEIINLLLWATLRWVDPYLVWNPQDFDGCINVKVPADLIWLPDVYFVNALDIESISLTDNDMVEITDVGKVRLGLKYKVELTCPMKIGDFPFDTQNCPIVIGVWSYNYSDTILHLRYPIVGLTAHNGDPEYAPIMANASEFEIVTFTGVEVMTTVGHNAYSELRYSIGLKRRPAYYVFVILIPSYLLTSLCIIGIFTPNSNMNERNERVTLGLTTLLSMTVILNIVADQMPKGREGLALLGIFVLYEIGICTLAIILSTFIIVCHQRANARCWKPPLFCLWIGRARVLKTDRVSSSIVKRDPKRYYERGSPDDGIKYIIDNNFERLGTNVRSVCTTLQNAIESMEKRVEEDEVRENREMIWQNFFDMLDYLLLVLLLLLNTLISYIILF